MMEKMHLSRPAITLNLKILKEEKELSELDQTENDIEI